MIIGILLHRFLLTHFGQRCGQRGTMPRWCGRKVSITIV